MRSHSTRYGRLHRHDRAEWKSRTHDDYSCKWMKTRTRTYTHFQLRAYPARLTGRQRYLQQHLTHSKCNYASKHCKPREMPHSMIVWHSVKHDSRLYHSLGMYETHEIDNYLLVPALAISGTIRHVRKSSALVLDSGYILVRMTHLNQTLAQVEKHITVGESKTFLIVVHIG